MTTNQISEVLNRRRQFLGTAAMTFVVSRLGMIGSADAQAGKAKIAQVPPIKPGTNTSFASMKQIDAGLLNVGYAEAGPAAGAAVILLHGWPYDIHSYVDVAHLLASEGFRVIVPYLRGYGSTRFLSSETMRNGQQAVVALPKPIERSSRANTRIGSSKAASDTICLRKRLRPLPRPWSTSTVWQRRPEPAQALRTREHAYLAGQFRIRR